MPSRTDLLFTIALFAAPAVYYAALVVCSASESLKGFYFVVFGFAVGTVLLILLGRLQ